MSKLSNTQSHSQSKATWGDDRLERHNERYRVAFNASILSNSPKPWIITINCFIFVAHNARGIPRRTVAGAVIGKLHIPYHSCAFSAFLNLFASASNHNACHWALTALNIVSRVTSSHIVLCCKAGAQSHPCPPIPVESRPPTQNEYVIHHRGARNV